MHVHMLIAYSIYWWGNIYSKLRQHDCVVFSALSPDINIWNQGQTGPPPKRTSPTPPSNTPPHHPARDVDFHKYNKMPFNVVRLQLSLPPKVRCAPHAHQCSLCTAVCKNNHAICAFWSKWGPLPDVGPYSWMWHNQLIMISIMIK